MWTQVYVTIVICPPNNPSDQQLRDEARNVAETTLTHDIILNSKFSHSKFTDTIDIDGVSDAAPAPVDSERGQAFLDDGFTRNIEDFKENIATLQEEVADAERLDAIYDDNEFHVRCADIGNSTSPIVHIYDWHGNGIRTRSDFDEQVSFLSETERKNLWVVPANLHF